MWSIIIGAAIAALAVIILKNSFKGGKPSCSSCAYRASCVSCKKNSIKE